MSNQSFKRGMVIDIDFSPTLGSETRKIRPCIVVSNNQFNAYSPIIQVTPITAWNEKKSRIKTNVELFPDINNGLSKNSVADCMQTKAVDIRVRVKRQRGVLSSKDMDKIDKSLSLVFALNIQQKKRS